MVISATGTTVSEHTAKRRIRNIIDGDRGIKSEVDAAKTRLDSKNLKVLSDIDADPSLSDAEKDEEKELKKRELAILFVYINNAIFQQKVLAAL